MCLRHMAFCYCFYWAFSSQHILWNVELTTDEDWKTFAKDSLKDLKFLYTNTDAEDPKVLYFILMNKYWLVDQLFSSLFVDLWFWELTQLIKGGQFEGWMAPKWPCPCHCCSKSSHAHMLTSCIILAGKRSNKVWLYGQQGQLQCKWCWMPKALWDAPNIILKAIVTSLSYKHSSMIMALKNQLPSVMSPGQEQSLSI